MIDLHSPADRGQKDRWAEELGEIGAASGAMLAALACMLWRAGCAPDAAVLIALHGDRGGRGVILLEEAQGAPAAAFRASVGVPSLHGAAGVAEMYDEDVEAQRLRLARDCMEEIAILGDMRRGDHERWTAAAGVEQRMLDNLDALVALEQRRAAGRFAADLSRRAAEISFPERGRAFALGLVLGCLDGDDPARVAVSALRKARPIAFGAWEAALCLASSPAVGPSMRRLLRSERAPIVRLALSVLRFRREAELDPIAPLLGDPEPRVRAAAARCAIVAGARADVLPLLSQKLEDPDDAVALAAAEGLLLLDDPEGLSWVRARVREGPANDVLGRALRLLSLAGGGRDIDLLLDAAGRDPAAVIALGWHGHPQAIEPLIEMLARTRAARAEGRPARGAELDPARALHRITGAGLRVEPGQEALGLRPITDVEAWRAYLTAHRAELGRASRLRFGAPFTPAASLDELERDSTPALARRACALEAVLHLGLSIPLEVDDWSARQRAAIAALREALSRRPEPPCLPGEWPADRLGRRWPQST
jgi:hypothetical protein